MTSHLRQKLPPSLRVHYNPIILLIYIAPDISTFFEPRGPDFTDERTRDRTLIRQRVNCRRPNTPSAKITRSIFHGGERNQDSMVSVRVKSGDMDKVNQQGERQTRLAEVDPYSLSPLQHRPLWLDSANQGWQRSSRSTGSIKLMKRRSSKASSSPIRPSLLFRFLSLHPPRLSSTIV